MMKIERPGISKDLNHEDTESRSFLIDFSVSPCLGGFPLVFGRDSKEVIFISAR